VSIVLLLAVLAVLGGVALVAAGRGSAMPDAPPDRAPFGVLPPDAVGPAEVERLRFSLAFRGYRMDEVDDVLDRLTAELAERDARIAELTGADPAELTGADPAELTTADPERVQPAHETGTAGRDRAQPAEPVED
jgi:DivIVA domain-containing protein